MKAANELVERFVNELGRDAVGKAYAKDCAIISLEETVKAFDEYIKLIDDGEPSGKRVLAKGFRLRYQQQIEYLKSKL